MIKLVMVGHGNFASGIMTSLNLIAGPQENIEVIDFTSDMSSDDVKKRILSSIENVETVLVLCDLLGGTPFKVASVIMSEHSEKRMNVIAGLNLSMMLEATFLRLENLPFDKLVEKILKAARDGIIDCQTLLQSDTNEDESEFGI